MKKCKGIILVLCIAAVLLCGCTYQKNSESEATEQLPELKIGLDANYEPYTYVDENGDYAGLDIELAREACRRMGREPVFYSIKWDSKNAYLEDGSIDCIWSCFSMNGREDDYDWVGPYMYSRQMVVVCSDSDIDQLAELTGKSVAVMSSTKPESIFLKRESEDIPDVGEVYCMNNMDLVFSALQSGYVDAAAGHETVMRQYMETMPGGYRLLEETLLSTDVGIAFKKEGNAELSDELRQALKSMEADGTLQATLEKYEIITDSADGGEVQ